MNFDNTDTEDESDFDFDVLDTDNDEETSTEIADSSEQDVETEKQEVSETDNEAKYKLNYNGELIEKPVSELVSLAQKGMNYDKIVNQRDSLQNSPALQLINRLAQQSGMSIDEYVDFAQKGIEQSLVSQKMLSGISEDAAREMLAFEAEKKAYEDEKASNAQKMAEEKQYLEFLQEYPDVKQFPQEVIQRMATGESPLSAYRAYELKELKTQMDADKRNEKNKQSVAGSATGLGGAQTKDAFDIGWDAENNY